MRSMRSFLLVALALGVIAPRGAPAPAVFPRPVFLAATVADAPDAQLERFGIGAVETGGGETSGAREAGRSLAHRASAVGMVLLALWVTGSLLLGAFWALAGWVLGRPNV